MHPIVVIVQGAGASGKTFVARALADRLSLPLLAKDDFKELLFDRLGWKEDLEHSQLLGRLSFDLLYRGMELLLETGTDFIVEAKFDPALSTETLQSLMRRRPFLVEQVLCRADPETRQRRAVERRASGNRHPGHVDHLYLEGLTRLPSTEYSPMDLPGEIHIFDTTDESASSLDELVSKLRSRLESV